MATEMTWKKAIQHILREADGPVHYKEIAEQIVTAGLRKSVGATPAGTVSAILTTSVNKLGEKSPFVKLGNGEYTLRDTKRGRAASTTGQLVDEEEKQYEIVTSFGMFWRRDYVQWSPAPALLGMQQLGAQPVDFGKQAGIYLLYDGREVIYVGRTTERPLGRRLYEHTADRLSSRWDRFSWFGLLPVSDKGTLQELPTEYQASKVTPALEAILVEALEPRQNRKRGDDLSAVEYLQVEDPEIRKQKIKDTLSALVEKA